MPRKQDASAPQVLAYFKTAPIDAARLVLELAKGEVAARTPKKLREPIRMPDPKGPGPAPGTPVALAAPAAPTGVAPRQSRRQLRTASEAASQATNQAAASPVHTETDVPLPGMQAKVGD